MLDAYLNAWSSRTFDWRTANCAQFAAGWVEPRTKREAMRRITSYGSDLAEAVTLHLGEQIEPVYAQAGDVVILRLTLSTALGICTGRLAATLTEGGGLVMVPMTHAVNAWRI
jgi:hypothetical protein